ncbi:MAG: flagellar biosynthetic protein FliQ [Pseudomonadota bacterium]
MDVLKVALWAGFSASLPILMVALISGVGVGLLQALTSIQEMTLTFVPKLAAIAVAFWLSMGFMSAAFVSLWRDAILPIIAGAGP